MRLAACWLAARFVERSGESGINSTKGRDFLAAHRRMAAGGGGQLRNGVVIMV